MAILSSNAARQQLAAEQLSKKMTLERKLTVELRALFRQIALDFRILYTRTGSTVRAVEYMDELRGVLMSNYRRINRAFRTDFIRMLRQNMRNATESIIANLTLVAQAQGLTLPELIDRMEESIILDSSQFVRTEAERDSRLMTRTTQSELEAAIVFAVPLLQTRLEREPTRAEVAKAASFKFVKNSIPRSNMASATGTQKIAEGTKNIEFDTVLSTRNSVAEFPPLRAEEEWVSTGDKRVRRGQFSHVEADGQRKVSGGTYMVGGELLRFPGDASLGASAGNIINCRCASIPVINDQPIAEL